MTTTITATVTLRGCTFIATLYPAEDNYVSIQAHYPEGHDSRGWWDGHEHTASGQWDGSEIVGVREILLSESMDPLLLGNLSSELEKKIEKSDTPL